MYHGSINGTGCSKFESLTTTWLKEPWVANKIFIINRFKNFWHRLKASLSSFKMNYQTHSYHSWVIAIFVNPTSLSLRWRCLIAYALLPRSQSACDRVPMRSIDIQMFSTRSSLSLSSIRNCTARYVPVMRKAFWCRLKSRTRSDDLLTLNFLRDFTPPIGVHTNCYISGCNNVRDMHESEIIELSENEKKIRSVH